MAIGAVVIVYTTLQNIGVSGALNPCAPRIISGLTEKRIVNKCLAFMSALPKDTFDINKLLFVSLPSDRVIQITR
ncbi:hypothetical protein KCTC52924_01099 [Arenibacter antarcticus]